MLQLENNEEELSQIRLEKCLATLNALSSDNEEEEVKNQGLKVLVNFNYGICMEKQMKLYSAKQVYEEILKNNKYHLDSALRLANVEYQLGNYRKFVEILEEIDKLCEENRKILKI